MKTDICKIIVLFIFTFTVGLGLNAKNAYARTNSQQHACDEWFANCHYDCAWYDVGCMVTMVVVCGPLADACTAQ